MKAGIHHVLFCFAVATLAAACGGSGEDHADQVGEVGEVAQELAPPGSNAAVVSTAGFPASFFPGERRVVSVTMRNTGAVSPANDWTSPTYKLFTNGGGWGWSYTNVPARTIVGAQATFFFIVEAPATAIPFRAQMYASSLFGQMVSLTPSIDVNTVPDWNCTLVSGVPRTMTPGEVRTITATVRNTGTKAWSPPSNFALAGRDNPVNYWGTTYTFLTAPVAPGATTDIKFSIRAPSNPGTYTFQREMKTFNQAPLDFRNSGFCIDTSIAVGGTPILDSQVVSTNFPSPMNTGDTASATVTMRNTGTETWDAGSNYTLYSQNSPTNLWGGTVLVNNPTTAATGSTVTFTVPIRAPAIPGTYPQVWRMRKMSGVNAAFFGAATNVPVTVAVGTSSYNAAVVSQAIPSPMFHGQRYTFRITMKNSGTTAWSGSQFGLASVNSPSDLWGPTFQALGASETVAPGASRIFDLAVTAPATPGTYASSWQMRGPSGVENFGGVATKTGISVTEGSCAALQTSPAGKYPLRLHSTQLTEICYPDTGCTYGTVSSDDDGTLIVSLRNCAAENGVCELYGTLTAPYVTGGSETGGFYRYAELQGNDFVDYFGGFWSANETALYPNTKTVHLAYDIYNTGSATGDFFTDLFIDRPTGVVTQLQRHAEWAGISLHTITDQTGTGALECNSPLPPLPCTAGATQCSGRELQTCDGSGSWQTTTVCSSPNSYCDLSVGCAAAPPSCQNLPAVCGPAANESCCESPLVAGGTFYRSYDGMNHPVPPWLQNASFDFTSTAYPATVSDFRLDKYEITVGRFRKFVTAWNAGWRPAAGAGKHAQLNGGNGLSATSGGYEPGWDTAWASRLSSSASEWNANLACDSSGTWTSAPGSNETKPINCANWYETAAFCIWDGAFLPSESEWNYAAAGGSEQRVYAWSDPPTSTTMGSSSNGKYGQADLAGSVWEWNVDSFADYVTPCQDCGQFSTLVSNRAMRGGGDYAYASRRASFGADMRARDAGARCARVP